MARKKLSLCQICHGRRCDSWTESERSGERLLKAARRVSGSESINKILEIFTELSGLGQEEIQGSGFESGFFRAVVAWINAGVVESAVDPNPVGAVDPSAIF